MYDANEIANEFGQYYVTMGADLARKIPESKKKVQEYVHDIPHTLNSLAVRRVEYTDIEKIVSALPAKTSSGHDGISNQFSKQLNSSISYPLSIIFNQSLSSGVFLEKMKLAEIVPLFKGKEEDMVVNYRPVSLLMTISKVLEKIMYNKMYGFLSCNNIFFDSQYGFWSKRSCEHVIMEMAGHVLQAKNEGKHSMGVFLDLSKVFDTLDHPVLITKLERYGIRGNMLNWFKSYLSGRSLVAKISNSTNVTMYSEKYDITFGTAQGSCLGPLLFVIFCNDIYMLPKMGNLILFADDTTLIETHRNRKFLDYAVCHDMLLLMDWFIVNKLMLNLNKTVVMNFWPGNKKGINSINIMDVNIPFVQITRFLGVYLDENMDWKYHSNQVYNKIQSNKQLLNISKNLMDLKTLIKIYYAHIHSHLNYGLIVWGSMLNKTLLNDRECLQKACIWLVNRTKKSSPTNILFKRNKILKFPDMINLELQKFGSS